MKKTLGIISIIMLLASCKGKDKLPAGILPQDKMVEVTWDMMRTGEFLTSYVFTKPNVDRSAEAQLWYDKVYAMHNTTREQFDKSYAYYREHTELMKAVMDSISKKNVTPAEPFPTVVAEPEAVKQDTTAKKDTLRPTPRSGMLADSLGIKRKLLLKPKPV